MMNVIQLILLLPVLVDYMPDNVSHFIFGLDYFSLSFNFIPLTKIQGIKNIIEYISDEQEDLMLQQIGVEYESTLGNTLMVWVVFIFGNFREVREL
jgi:hypothetical protein